MARPKKEPIGPADVYDPITESTREVSRIPLKFAQLHAPLFLAGTNFKEKLDITQRTGLFITYDLDLDGVWIEYNGEVSWSPSTAGFNYIAKNSNDWGYALQGKAVAPKVITNMTHPQTFGSSRTAQVADPIGVFKPLVK